ncbi:probable leucine-rich repeat receptor-like protein kinase At1g35710 [Cryptomeria japonica]|uniref:probable leucine-rich repeat receptor-like protein kinase At1g35710 n=1 Tax=Cryptomeria japonica TaxID=3369 RepID=UPI0027DA4463|nr:probable leucine-rich repeat receptor-like protein kinase At1g35710 [Cryptomeria japonica]
MARVKQLFMLFSIYSLYLSGVAADMQCNEADRKALLKIKAGITQDPTGVLSSWGGKSDCCHGNWRGVGCDVNTGRVTLLFLEVLDSWNTSEYMVGTLSKSIGDLTELVYIFLPAWKRITGKIPNSMARLVNLKMLDLSKNDFTGKMPSWIPELSKLTMLRLGGNRLRGKPIITKKKPSTMPKDKENPQNSRKLCRASYKWLKVTHSPSFVSTETIVNLLGLLSIYALYSSRVAADVQCNEADRKALLEIKAGIIQDPTGALSSWGRIPNCCNWDGVSCDVNTGRVTMIQLSPSDPSNTTLYMAGTLSKSIGDLTELVYFQIPRWRKITGKIPNSIARLQHLDLLDLADNDFLGKMPSWIPRLSKLRVLSLSRNRLRGIIPPAITTMSNLEVLELEENRITGTIPHAMGNLSRLDTVRLNNNLLYGSLPESIGFIPTLFLLDASHNALVGRIPSSYGNLSGLGMLSLNNNKLTYIIPSSLGRLSRLFWLHLEDNRLTGYIPASMGNLSRLNNLDLSRNFLGGPMPASFSLLSFLDTFKVSGNKLTNPLPSLPSLPSFLDLSYNEFKLGNSIPTWITNSSFGIEISLAGCGIDMRFEDWKPRLKDWTATQTFLSVDLSANNIRGSAVEFFEAMTFVRHANLSNNQLSYNFSSGVNFSRWLQTLDLHSNQLYGSITPSIGKLIDLKTLDLSKNGLTEKIPGEMLNLRNLTQLNVSYNQLCGEIPQGKPLNEFPVSSYSHNKCLCGLPLGPC